MNMIYFDNSATTRPHKLVIDDMSECMESTFANPSSAHKLGLQAEKRIKQSREKVAALIGANPGQIVFTSGGSESNNMAIRGVLSAGDHIITSTIEHPSVLYTLKALEHEGFDVTYIDVDRNGQLNLDMLKKSIRQNTRLVTVMHVNNEIGSIQPIEAISRIVRDTNKKTRIHIDAVQSAGKLKIDVKKTDIDLLSLSAHKIHGPKGVGALFIKTGFVLKPLILGGGQEMDLRSGTENVPGISGFGIAANMAADKIVDKYTHVTMIKKHFIDRLSEIQGVIINSPLDDLHISNILSVSFDGVRGEVLLHGLEEYNIYVSTGSACSSKKSAHKNYVLPAIGLEQCFIEGTIRFSFSYYSTIEEVDMTIETLKKVLTFLRRVKR